MTTDDLLVDPGEFIDPILVRMIDDEPGCPPYVEIIHAGAWESVMIEAVKVPELIAALRSLVPAEDDPNPGGGKGNQPA